MLLVIFIAGAILWNLPWSKYDSQLFVSAVQPGYLDFDNLPDTNFSCDGKVIGGYYADIETGCQMFHVCTIGQKSEITDIKFLCLNGTVFDQETRVCERLDEVDCSRSESFFDLNLELYGNNGGGYGIQPEDEGKEQEGHNCEDEYEDGESSCKNKPEKTNATEHKDAEYTDWEESTTDSGSRVSSTSSTTTPKPSVTTSLRPTSTSPSKFHFHSDVSIPSTTADPGLQLLALHENFQHNLKQHDTQSKLRPINVPPKNTSIFNYPKKPSPFPTYQIPNNAPQAKPPSYFPLSPSKLPNSLSNLSQNKNPLPTSLANSNRTPQPFPVTFKPEPPLSFYTEKQRGQKVTNKATLPPLPGPPKHPNIEPPVLYAYKIVSTDSGRPDRFGSTNVRYSLQSSPVTAPGKPFETAHPTFTIAQNRPYSFPPKPPHFLTAKEEFEDDADEEDVLLEKARQLQPKLDGYNMHSNFARAIADRPKNASNPAISVVLSSSSVSSSISSKPQSAISNITTNAGALSGLHQKSAFSPNQNANFFKSSIPSSTLVMLKNSQPNITEINDSLTEEQPYYDDANVEYDENSHEYKDILYPSDVQKIKQR